MEIRFLDEDETWEGRIVGWGQRLLGDHSRLNHVVMLYNDDLLIEATWYSLDVDKLTDEMRQIINERTRATVRLMVDDVLWSSYLMNLLSHCDDPLYKANLWDYMLILLGRTPNHAVCTYPVLELLDMKYDTYLLPKNLLGYFIQKASMGKRPTLGITITEICDDIQTASS